MKKLFFVFALAVGLLTSATLQAQTVNMSNYITLTVKKDSEIKLNFKAVAAGTPVRIVSGSHQIDITVSDWLGGASYIAEDTTMTIYGNIISFVCRGNGANLTAIDVSNNTQLTMLNCGSNHIRSLDVSYNTNLTDLSCSHNILSTIDVSNNPNLTTLSCSDNYLNSLDLSNNTRLERLYCYDNNFSTQTLDDIYCILPDRMGKTNGVICPIKESSSQNISTVFATNKANATAKNWKVQYFVGDNNDIPATSGTYRCPHTNMDRYITLTVDRNKGIILDLKAATAGTPIRIVSGTYTQDTTVSTFWAGTDNYDTPDTTMTIYGDLTGFDCSGNGANLIALDVSHNTLLTELYCSDNNLTTLDVSNNTQLEKLYCHGNNLTTAALDRIYCALPDRIGNTNGVIQPVYNSSSSNIAAVLATNAQNAIAKNWKVRYYDGNTDIPATTGSYDCSTAVAEATAEPSLTLYPNPVADVLYLSATARTIHIYNIYGVEVAHATDTDRIDVASLPAGVYTVRADGTVAKMVKR